MPTSARRPHFPSISDACVTCGTRFRYVEHCCCGCWFVGVAGAGAGNGGGGVGVGVGVDVVVAAVVVAVAAVVVVVAVLVAVVVAVVGRCWSLPLVVVCWSLLFVIFRCCSLLFVVCCCWLNRTLGKRQGKRRCDAEWEPSERSNHGCKASRVATKAAMGTQCTFEPWCCCC